VKVYHAKLETLLLLWMAIQVIGYFGSPRVGRIIDRIGERRVLVFYFTCVTFVFLGYAFIPNREVLFVFFVADSAFSMCGTAMTTYVNRIAPPSEHTQTLSMGVAMNHVGAVTMPLVGGWLWETGYRWTFLVGAVAAAASIIAALRVPRHGVLPRAAREG
jgi:MFS family permease